MVLGFVIWKKNFLMWFQNQRRNFWGSPNKSFDSRWKFRRSANQIKKSAWKSFKSVVKFFLGNRKAPNYREIVGELLQSYQDMGCNMSLKIHFLDSHLDFFPDSLGAVSEDHGNVSTKTFLPWKSARMLADYCWTMKRDVPDAKHRRQSTSLTF